MQLRDFIGVAPRFTRSVNLERDANALAAIDGYILTSTAQSVLERLALSLSGPSGQRAWTITGPYGSGKSAFALYLSHLVGPPESPSGKAARTLLKAQAPHLQSALLDRRSKHAVLREGFYPVLVSGAPEPLIPAIMRALARQLRPLLGGGRVPECVKRIEAISERAEQGEHISGTSLVQAIKSVVEHVRGTHRAQGVFLIVDELGKFLEYSARESEVGDVFVLQELAEAASAGNASGLCLVTILHQAFERYAVDLTASVRDEWAKIQGRFEDVAFQEPPEQLIDLLSHAISQSSHAVAKELTRDARKLAETAAGLGLAPRGLTKQQFVQAMARCAPLHPLTVLALVRLCRKFGQHQRSLFSFLISHEPHGFSSFLHQDVVQGQVPFYGLSELYDYVAEVLGNGLSMGESAARWAEVQGALDRAVGQPERERALIKIVGLLSAAGSYGDFKPTDRLLQFASSEPKSVRESLSFLVKRSYLVYRKHSQSYGVWQGSDIDLDERVLDAGRKLAADGSLARKLSRIWAPAPLVAKRHSFITGTLRYFAVRFADTATFSYSLQRDADTDGLLLYCLPASADEHQELVQLATFSTAREHEEVLIALPRDVTVLREAARELELLRWVAEHTPELSGDVVARRELRARLSAAERRVAAELHHLFSPGELDSRVTWYHRGLPQDVSSVRSLAHLVSDICDDVYEHTPRLRNELVNRRSLSSAAAKARRLLIEAMVTRGGEERLGIVGTPPEMSMYASILGATGIHRPEPGGYGFGAPTNDESLVRVWQEISAFFAACDVERRPVADLFRILSDRPFGLKQGVLPILFCAALLAHDTDVALYESGGFVPELTVEVFERLLRSPEKLELRRYQVTGVRREVFRQFAEIFGTRAAGAGADLVAVVRPLFRFFNKLPAYTRQHKRLTATAMRVRDALVAARDPDVLLFEDLPLACGSASFLVDDAAPGMITEFFRSLQGALVELQRAYDDLLLDLRQLLLQAFGVNGADGREMVRLRAQRLMEHALDARLKAFLLHLIDEQLDDVAWIEAIGTMIVGKAPRSWQDGDRTKYEVNLSDLVRNFRHIEALVFSLLQRGQEERLGDVVRIGVTDRHTKDREAVVVVPSEDRVRVTNAMIAIEERLASLGLGDQPELALAALARAAQGFLAQLSAPPVEAPKKEQPA